MHPKIFSNFKKKSKPIVPKSNDNPRQLDQVLPLGISKCQFFSRTKKLQFSFTKNRCKISISPDTEVKNNFLNQFQEKDRSSS